MKPVHHNEVTDVKPKGFAGTMPLPIRRAMTPDGMVETSAWVPTEPERKLLRLPNCYISVVLLTHEDGSQSLSLRVGTVDLIPDQTN